MRLTADELRIILDALGVQYGSGYSANEQVAKLQAKLSVMLSVANMSADGLRSGVGNG